MVFMESISSWLEHTSLSHAVSVNTWAVPALQTVHIAAVAIVFSAAVMLDFRLAGVTGRHESLRSNALPFYPRIKWALLVLIATGIFQIIGEPARELQNWIFWTKMGLIVVACLLTAATRPQLAEMTLAEHTSGGRARIRLLGVVSLVMWVAVITCGRWIAYAGGPAA